MSEFRASDLKPIVLAVDDEPNILDAITDSLEDEYTILTATSGEEAIKIVEMQPKVAVVLCDQRMPRMQGSEVLRRVRELSQAARVMITGYSDLSAIVSAINDGQIQSYISKPFQGEQLLMAVGAAYKSYELMLDLRAERELLHALMDCMPDFIYFKDADGRFLRVNKAMADHLGFEKPELVIGRRESYFVAADRAVEIAETERKILKEGAPLVHDVRLHSDEGGNDQWWSTVTVPIRRDGETISGMIAIRRDVTEERRVAAELADRRSRQAELEEANRKIRHAAVHDPLTGLPNRILLEDRVQQLQIQSRRRGLSVAFIYIDLDGFKAVNDTLGHEAGDQVLKTVAELISSLLRESDIAARLGGDEFVVVGEVDRANAHEGARLVAERIRKSIDEGVRLPDPKLKIGSSIGVAVFPDDTGDFAGIMRLADRAMYAAKKAGKNAVVLASPL